MSRVVVVLGASGVIGMGFVRACLESKQAGEYTAGS